jgi:hypothetical protein
VRVSLFPNPASETASLAFGAALPTRADVTIRDVLGRRVAGASAAPGADHLRLDLSALAAGVYVYHVTIGGRSESRRFTVVR